VWISPPHFHKTQTSDEFTKSHYLYDDNDDMRLHKSNMRLVGFLAMHEYRHHRNTDTFPFPAH